MILREEEIAGLTGAPIVHRRGLILSMPHPNPGRRPIECHLDEQDVRHLRDLLTEALDD